MSTGSANAAPPRRLRGTEQDALVTGEAVLIDIPSAPLPTRLVASVIDWILWLLVLAVLAVIAFFSTAAASVATQETLLLVVVVLSVLVVPVTVETLTRGRSLGKKILKLRVVRDDGGPIVFRHAFVRGLVGVVEFLFLYGVPALIASASNQRGKRLGDFAAGTYVVREQTGLKLQPPPPAPAYLRQWAVGADLAPLPDGLALGVRQFLLRRSMLTPDAREALTTSLLAQVLPLVAPPPPADANPEDVLCAVLTTRGDRDAARLARERRTRERLVPADPMTPLR